MLSYVPVKRVTALEACAHPFFDQLRSPDLHRLPGDVPLPVLFNWSEMELAGASKELREVLVPPHARQAGWSSERPVAVHPPPGCAGGGQPYAYGGLAGGSSTVSTGGGGGGGGGSPPVDKAFLSLAGSPRLGRGGALAVPYSSGGGESATGVASFFPGEQQLGSTVDSSALSPSISARKTGIDGPPPSSSRQPGLMGSTVRF